MKTTEVLIKEHENILEIVELLEKESENLGDKKIDREFYRKVIDFIRNYADKFHHAKEEDILFKEFCKAVEEQKAHCNPVEQMLHEHNLGRNFVKEMEQGLKEENKAKILDGAKGYAGLIREHIFKENNILYPMADEILNEKIQKSMIEKFKQAGQNKEKYLLTIKELKKR